MAAFSRGSAGKVKLSPMGKRWFAAVIAALACVALPLLAAPVERGGFSDRLLAAHNRERARLGIPGLAWNDRLAGQAQQWANSLARRRAFEHARGLRGVGENLWTGTTGFYSPEEMIGGFIEEAQHFRPGKFPNVSRTGNWSDVGHYTQLIWPATREVGCALARGRSNEVLVCRYWPAGNVIGQRVP
jgi:uncharacterized protein YkwD